MGNSLDISEVVFRRDGHKEMVSLWLGGMPQSEIASYVGHAVGTVRDALQEYCKREKQVSQDGRSWCYRLQREIHPNAPLSRHEQYDEYSLHNHPETSDGYTDDPYDEYVGAVLDAATKLNQALEQLYLGTPLRTAINTRDGFVHVAVHDPDGASS